MHPVTYLTELNGQTRLSQLIDLDGIGSGEKLQEFWKSLSSEQSNNDQNFLLYLDGLKHFKCRDEMRLLVKARLKKHDDYAWLKYYPPSSGDSLSKQINWLNGLLKKNASNLDLLLCLAQHHMVNRTWMLAKKYLLQLIDLAPESYHYTQLGDVHYALGEQEEALDCYQKACHFKPLLAASELKRID